MQNGQVDGGLEELVSQIKAASDNIAAADEAHNQRLDDMNKMVVSSGAQLAKLIEDHKAWMLKTTALETSINELYRNNGRPGAEGGDTTKELKERDSAVELLRMKHEMKVIKKDLEHQFNPSEDQIKEAMLYSKALKAAFNTLDHKTLPEEYRKSLSAFSFGTNAFILEPEMSNQVIRCIVDPTDLGGLMESMTIAAPSVRFLIDNARMFLAAWACEASCFANNPQPDLSEGLGELEIKPETIRFICCVTRDLLEDASINVEQWITRRVSEGMRATINASLLLGDGVGKPLGILNPRAGIPICDVSLATPDGQFTWQDLVMLKYEIPMQWQDGCVWLMNQRTYNLIMTMSTADGRPLFGGWGVMPGREPGLNFAGSPVQIVSQMPDVGHGTTPIAFGNFKRAYIIVWRKAITMQVDPYSAGFCVLYRFEARVGGGILCPNAVRLLRIR